MKSLELPELKASWLVMGAWAAAFFTFFASYNIFHFFCHDWGMSTFMAGITAAFVLRLVPTLVISKDPMIVRPPARPYALSPMYALTEIKDAMATQYFGDKRWHLENVNPESLSLFYTCKFQQEMGSTEHKDRQDVVLTMRVQVASIAEASTVQIDFDTISGGVSQDINDIFSQTNAFIKARLLNLQAQLNSGAT
ncbi:MAG: hypothetical protein KGS72_27915 [Cyanobacteria bacterium REEB67]|nr:hypothetical protein [Cyanobacteria bacterium REEB67]